MRKLKKGGDNVTLQLINATDQYRENIQFTHKTQLVDTTDVPTDVPTSTKRFRQLSGKYTKIKKTDLIKTIIPNIYTLFNDTNNGTIMSNSNLKDFIDKIFKLKDNELKECADDLTGGDTLNNLVSQNILTQLTNYCQTGVDSEEDLKQYILNNNISTKICKSDYNQLKEFIDINKGDNQLEYILKFNINDNKYIQYDTSNETAGNAILTFSKTYNCYEYNEDIIKAYEMPFIYSRYGIYNFIEDQKNYLNTLTKIDKRVIADYTKKSSFDFYKIYKSCQASQNFTNFNNYNKYFGDSFYPDRKSVV